MLAAPVPGCLAAPSAPCRLRDVVAIVGDPRWTCHVVADLSAPTDDDADVASHGVASPMGDQATGPASLGAGGGRLAIAGVVKAARALADAPLSHGAGRVVVALLPVDGDDAGIREAVRRGGGRAVIVQIQEQP